MPSHGSKPRSETPTRVAGETARVEPRLEASPAQGGAVTNVASAEGQAPSEEIDIDLEPDPVIPPAPSVAAREARGAGALASDAAISRRRRVRLAAAAGAALIIVAAAGWWTQRTFIEPVGTGEIPLIMAAEGPEKIRPESEGGLAVPNQDRLIYDQLDGGDGEPQVENLLPPPEPPILPPTLAPGSTGEAAGIPVVPAPPLEAPSAEAPEDAPETADVPSPGEEEDVAALADPGIEELTPAAGGIRIQLASLKSAAAAKDEWVKLGRRHPEVLEGLTLIVEKVDLGSQGVFYRVQAGPLPDRAAAQEACARLKQKNQSCLVVAP